jgi:hypothetical protein
MEDSKAEIKIILNTIRNLQVDQEILFDKACSLLDIQDDERKKDWLFDAAFNDCDFDLIWEEKLKL